jgi:dTDP-glucose 4,6-dehydratase
MRIFITGIAGVLGSNLARIFYNKGYVVVGNDKVRIEEAWRLEGIKEGIIYIWKSSIDLKPDDIEGTDILIDCALESADRPFGINSPNEVTMGNLLPPLTVLECIRKCKKKPIAIYPSSFNALYGHDVGMTIDETTTVLPSTLYGWTKGAAELLYLSYYKSYNIPVIITRVGSGYGPTMRSDELIAKLIIHCLQDKEFYLRSPEAKRLWCYMEDVLDFYGKLVENAGLYIGKTLHVAGNKNNEILTNIEVAKKIQDITGHMIRISMGHYEPGEMIDNKPIDFKVDSSRTEDLLCWEPKHSLDEGLTKTVKWFEENIWRYKL